MESTEWKFPFFFFYLLYFDGFPDADQTRDDDGGGHGGEDEAQHEADCDGEVEEEEGEGGHSCGLHQARDEGGAEDHPTQPPQRHGVHLQPGPDEDDGEAEGPQLAGYQRVQLVPDVLGSAVLLHLLLSTSLHCGVFIISKERLRNTPLE